MKKLFGLLLFSTVVLAQSVPNGTIVQGQIWTPAQWNTAWQSKVDIAQLGVTIPTYPQTSAEISAGIIPSSNLYPVGNALRYGCDPSGASSSDACFATEATYLNSVGGGTIYLPAGTYKTSGASFPHANVLVQGAGSSATYIQNTSTNKPALTFGDNVSAFFHGGVTGITFSGAAGVTGVTGQTAFTFQKVGQFFVRDVLVASSPTAIYRGVVFLNASQFVVNNLIVQGALLDGVTLIGTTDAYVTDSHSDGNGGSGWTLDTTQGGNFKGDTAFANVANAWHLASSVPSTAVNKNNTFVNCAGDTSGSHNWFITDSQNTYFVASWGSSQLSTSVNTFAVGFFISTSFSKGIVFTGGEALNNNAHGVQVFDDGTTGAPISIVFNGFQFGSTANGANGNGKSGTTAYGLTLNGNVNKVRTNGGIFDGNLTGPYLNTSAQPDICLSGSPIGAATQVTCNGWSIDGSGNMAANSVAAPSAIFTATGGNALLATGVASSYAVRIVGSSTASASKGAIVLAGTNASDSALQVTNQANTITFLNIFGDGGTIVGSPTGSDKGLGSLNAVTLWQNGVALAASATTDTTNATNISSGTIATARLPASSVTLAGTSGSIGGGALIAGQCASGTATVTSATTSMVALADPNTYPGDGTIWDAQVTASNTVTVKVCAIIALTPTSSTYNVRVLQ